MATKKVPSTKKQAAQPGAALKSSASKLPAAKSAASSASKSAAASAAKKSAGKNAAASKSANLKHTDLKKTSEASSKATGTGRPAAVAPSGPARKNGSRKAAADRYTDPALRERIKAKVLREDKGGRPGQWSARKAQMVAHEYEAAGGKFKGGPDPAQQSLTTWGDEHWTTKDGKPALREDGMHRYLPETAWQDLTPAQKRSTEKKKLAGDKQGKQFVANTTPAVKARRKAEQG